MTSSCNGKLFFCHSRVRSRDKLYRNAANRSNKKKEFALFTTKQVKEEKWWSKQSAAVTIVCYVKMCVCPQWPWIFKPKTTHKIDISLFLLLLCLHTHTHTPELSKRTQKLFKQWKYANAISRMYIWLLCVVCCCCCCWLLTVELIALSHSLCVLTHILSGPFCRCVCNVQHRN